jgi:predicted AAA+ superfamily ATPase
MNPGVNFFLFGPRGTGKSTWLKMQFKNALYIDLLSPELFRQYSARPERLREIVEGNPDKKVFIIDEIQKVPIKMEGLVRNIGDFSVFLEVISFSNASILNASEIARECRVGRKAAEGYMSVLNDLMLSYTLPVFTKKVKRHLISHPKFYFFDAGVFKALRPSGPLDRLQEIEGAAFETLVA